VSTLDGLWKVERVSGALPPMLGVRKRVEGSRGATLVGPLAVPFETDGRTLRYRPPFQAFVDVLEPDGDAFSGRATFLGRELGCFRLTRLAS
jgi:hypothetical protein